VWTSLVLLLVALAHLNRGVFPFCIIWSLYPAVFGQATPSAFGRVRLALTPYQAYIKAVTHPNHGIVCDQNIDELRRVYNRKFPHKIQVLERFLTIALTVLEVVSTPAIKVSDEELIRDTSDRPILRAYCGKS